MVLFAYDNWATIFSGRTALLLASFYDIPSFVDKLIDSGADPSRTEFNGWNSLFVVKSSKVTIYLRTFILDVGF